MRARGVMLMVAAAMSLAAVASPSVAVEPSMPPPAALPASGFAPGLEAVGIGDIQRQLKLHGYDPGDATGAMNQATYGAIIAYERDYGLAPDGIAGPLVQNALHFMPRPAPAAPTPPAVVEPAAMQVPPPQAPSAALPAVLDKPLAPKPPTAAPLDPPPRPAPRVPVAAGPIGADATPPQAAPAPAPSLAMAPNVDAGPSPVDADVLAAQTNLRKLGFYDGDIDGVLNWRTVEALVKFDASGKGPGTVIADPNRPADSLLARLKAAAAAGEQPIP